MNWTVRKFVSIAGTAASIYCGIRNNEWGQMVPSCHNVPTLVGVGHDVTLSPKLSAVHLNFYALDNLKTGVYLLIKLLGVFIDFYSLLKT